MDLEVQILLYYSKVFSLILLILIFIFTYSANLLFKKKILLESEILSISSGENIDTVIDKNIKKISNYDFFIFKLYYYLNINLFKKGIHYGDFYINNDITFHNLFNIISKPSNILNKITIVEGWSKKEIEKELSKFFDNIHEIPYDDILADTYYFEKNNNFEFFF